MKKIFTLVICAAASLSAFALEQQLLASPQSLDTEETGWFPGICIDKAPFFLTSSTCHPKIIFK